MERLDENNQPVNENKPVVASSQEGTIATIAYLWFLGWIIAYVLWNDKNKQNKTELTNFHIRQALGVNILVFLSYGIGQVFTFIPFGGIFSTLIYIAALIFVIIGLISAANKEIKLLPVVGQLFQDSFKNLK